MCHIYTTELPSAKMPLCPAGDKASRSSPSQGYGCRGIHQVFAEVTAARVPHQLRGQQDDGHSKMIVAFAKAAYHATGCRRSGRALSRRRRPSPPLSPFNAMEHPITSLIPEGGRGSAEP